MISTQHTLRGREGKNLLETVKVLRALVVEFLRARQARIIAVGVLGDPHRHVGVGPIHLPDMARQPLEVPVPVHRDEIRAALPRTRREEGLQPCEASGRARHGRRAEFDTHLLQRLHLPHPRLRRELGVDVAAAVTLAVGLVEGEHVGDVGAAFDEVGDVVEEGVVGGAGGGAPQHRHEFELGAVVEGGGGLRAVVVVPC